MPLIRWRWHYHIPLIGIPTRNIVADVAAPFQQVFALTNHIDYPWTENPEVIWHAADRSLRSTSVGDVIVDCNTQQTWLIMPFGFHPL
jgi:hypothetical protein